MNNTSSAKIIRFGYSNFDIVRRQYTQVYTEYLFSAPNEINTYLHEWSTESYGTIVDLQIEI